MKVEILMSACKVNKIKELDLKNKNIDNAVIVNQLMKKESVIKEGSITMYSVDEKGISRSRNRLLKHATGDVEVFTDDDITFVKNWKEIVSKAYLENDADIIIFNLQKGKDILGSDKKFIYNKYSILSVCSCQITFRLNSVKKKELFFDEQFGIGSTFVSGEENIFLKDALDANLKIIHMPIVLNSHTDEDTTGELWNDITIKSKGALMYRLFKRKYFIFLIYFTIFKRKYYKEKYSILKFIKLFNKGKKEYKALSK